MKKAPAGGRRKKGKDDGAAKAKAAEAKLPVEPAHVLEHELLLPNFLGGEGDKKALLATLRSTHAPLLFIGWRLNT